MLIKIVNNFINNNFINNFTKNTKYLITAKY